MKKQGKSKLGLIVLVFVAILSISPYTFASTAAKHIVKKNKHEGTYLFVQSSTKATIKVNKNHEETYTITLKNVDPLVTYFSDRPIRNAGEVSMDKFLTLWYHKNENSFKITPPNAVLHAKKTNFFSPDHVFNFAIEITNPHYDRKSNTLIFIAKPLPGNVDPLPDFETLHHVSVFIDSVCLTCWGK